MTHSKQKGNLGFSATIKELHRLGINVFSEIGDLSRIDIIAEVEKTLLTIQVKYATEKKSSVELPLRKCGPNGYKYVYDSSDVDIFSVYLPIKDKVIFIPSSLACKNKSSFIIRFEDTQHKNQFGVHYIKEFDNLKSVLDRVKTEKLNRQGASSTAESPKLSLVGAAPTLPANLFGG